MELVGEQTYLNMLWAVHQAACFHAPVRLSHVSSDVPRTGLMLTTVEMLSWSLWGGLAGVFFCRRGGALAPRAGLQQDWRL
eukprot:6461855-Amphidinium_carterae.1